MSTSFDHHLLSRYEHSRCWAVDDQPPMRRSSVRKFCVMAAMMAMALMVGVGVAGVASAAQDKCEHRFGSHQQVADGGGMQDWSVTGLKKSGDVTPGFPVAGQLWEATV